MTRYILTVCTFFLLMQGPIAQVIEQQWLNTSVESAGTVNQQTYPDLGILKLEDGEFTVKNLDYLTKDNGYYIFQNNVLVLYYQHPIDTTRTFKVNQLTDSTMELLDRSTLYRFERKEKMSTRQEAIIGDKLVPSAGFSINSLWRGALGILTLLIIAYLLSADRKAIQWKTVTYGLAIQLLIAVGVLQATFIKNIFEAVGKVFVNILDFTRARKQISL